MSARTRVVLLPLSVMLLAVVSSHRAAAQAVTDTAATAAPINPGSPTAVDAGPTMQSLSVGVQRQAAQPVATPAAARRSGIGQPEALMIVGGAALLLGAVIGDDPGTILMIGGAIVFLAGLYKYLQ
jgi:hypothetical protein